MDNIINSKNMKNILQQAGCNTPASEAQIKLCNVKLIQHGFPELPEGFAKVLLEANGLTADDANIFGVGLEEGGWFDDVCDYNIQHCQAPSKRLVLGYDDDTRLIYYAEEKLYRVESEMGKDMESNDVIEALEYFLRIQ